MLAIDKYTEVFFIGHILQLKDNFLLFYETFLLFE